MKGITWRCGYWLVGAGVGLAALSIFFTFVPNLPGQQQEDRRPAQPTGIRTSLGAMYSWRKSAAGEPCLQARDESKIYESGPVWRLRHGRYANLDHHANHRAWRHPVGPRPGVLWILAESPQSVLWIPTDGRPHSDDPDISFVGESVGRWEGDTLVVDTVGIDHRMRNISVGLGDGQRLDS